MDRDTAQQDRDTAQQDNNPSASIEQRGQASLDRSKMEQNKERDPEKYQKLSGIIHCPHGKDPNCPCVK
jgi:hypothetical protein